MPKRKTKTTEKEPAKTSTSTEEKFVVLRDLTNGMFLVIDFNDLSTNNKNKIATGSEVSYKTKNRDAGRGTVLLIDNEEKCLSLVKLLENKESSESVVAKTSSTIDESEASQDENDENDSEQSPTINKKTNQTTQPISTSSIEIIRSGSNRPLSENNGEPSSVTKKRSSENDHGDSVSKRLKEDEQSTTYLRSRIIALQDENKKMKNKIEEMETNWMPRPDQITIEYFSKIVDICTGRDKEDDESKGEKLANIMDILAMSEEELDRCIDSNSIRNTCRKVVRVVFKQELLNPKIHFRSVLQQKQKVEAIRAYGRLMHPLQSPKFTDGELNNSMGSDFYHRDHGLKIQKTQDKQTVETPNTDEEEEN